jgi:arylsulfatase A-like enzyme
MAKAKSDNKPFFVWMNTTRCHVLTHLSPKYEAMRNAKSGWGEEEAAMKQMDDNIGVAMLWLKENGLEQNTIVIFTRDNGAEAFTFPDGGTMPFAGAKGAVLDGGFRAPAIIKWPGHVPAGTVSSGIISGLDWFPTLTAMAGNPDFKTQLLKGVVLDGKNYHVHLDGYDQTPMITGQGPSNRHEI